MHPAVHRVADLVATFGLVAARSAGRRRRRADRREPGQRRRGRAGDVFVAVPGLKVHGATYAAQAVDAGAVAIAHRPRPGCDAARRPRGPRAGPAHRRPARARRPGGRVGARRARRAARLRRRHRAPTARPRRRTSSTPRCAPCTRLTAVLGTVELRIGEDGDREPAHHGRGARAAGPARRWRSSGTRPRSRWRSRSHALALGRVNGLDVRRRRVHQPAARPPRLPRRHGGLLPRQVAAVRARAGPPRRRRRRRRVGSPARRRGADPGRVRRHARGLRASTPTGP